MSWLFPLHPRLVHFPIALLLTGSLAALAYLLRWRRPGLATLAWSAVFLGWLSLFVAVLSGLIDQSSASQDEAVTALLNQHTAAGFGLIIVYGLLLILRLGAAAALDDPRLRLRLLLLLSLGAILVLVEANLGGRLVYDLGVGVGR